MPTPTTTRNYILRDIDPGLWKRAKARATRDGLTLRAVIFALLRSYVAGDVTIPTAAAVATSND